MSLIDRVKTLLRGRRRKGAVRRELLDATVRGAKAGWADQEFVDIVCREVGASKIVPILEASGYVVTAEGRLLQKPGPCQACGGYAVLQRGPDDSRWRCSDCFADELCSS